MSGPPLPPDNTHAGYIKKRKQRHRSRARQITLGRTPSENPTNDWLFWDVLRLHLEENEWELYQMLESLGYDEVQSDYIVSVLFEWVYDLEPDHFQ